ncbi:glucose 1-dehydrogenase [Micrococcales bacterium 31B]|nr:glucose 1-dehydrogenase [Micrococcales bacterium 31B]
MPITGHLEGRSVVVTGGNSGIGEAIARRAVAEGARVVIDYVERREAAEALADELGGPTAAIACEADVTDLAALDRLADCAVQHFGRLDAWVNCAGIGGGSGLLDTTPEQLDRVWAVNARAPFFGTQVAARRFITQGGGGVVLNISSTHEEWPMPGNIAYCVAKGGLRMLTRTAGVELGPWGIRVVNLAPGAILTPLNAAALSDPTHRAALEATIPVGYAAPPAEVASVAVHLLSDEARYVTATTVVVDGGLMQNAPGL